MYVRMKMVLSMSKDIVGPDGKVIAAMLTEEDVTGNIDDEIVAVIGYGSQGRGQSLNMRDSGINIILGLIDDPFKEQALKDGWKEGENVFSIEEASKKATIIYMLIPDTVQAKVYHSIVEKHMTEGKAIAFAHGYNIRFAHIKPPENVDIIMVAPKGPGAIVREQYEAGFGVPALIAVAQDYTKKAKNRALGIAHAIGATRPGVLETTFNDETETDLFGEQVDLCGGVVEMVKAAYETLLEDGRNPVLAYWEVHHELYGLISPLCYKFGNAGMLKRVSDTAKDGAFQSGPRVIDSHVKENMKAVLDDIKTGKYAEGWDARYAKKGRKAVTDEIEKLEKHPVEVIGKQVRKVMWPKDNVE